LQRLVRWYFKDKNFAFCNAEVLLAKLWIDCEGRGVWLGCEDSFACCPCTQRRGGIDVVEASGGEVVADSESLL